MTNKKFIFLYLIGFFMTYIVRYLFVMSGETVGVSFSVGTGDYASGESFLGGAEWVLIAVYAFMAYVAFSRGKACDKNYLYWFPVIGGIIDVFFMLLVFIPTVFNVIGLILGIPEKTKSST